MKKTLGLRIFICCVLITTIVSCKKQESISMQQKSDAVFPTTEKEKQTVAVLKEVGEILQNVYRKPQARYEAISAINTGYYEDERVLLKDLLFPENSPVYATDKFKASGADKGEFKKYFFETFSKGNYPNLKAAMGSSINNTRTGVVIPGGGVDSTNEIWTNSNGVSIYFPYSENFSYINPTDPNNNTVNGNLVTIVYADRDADSGPGQEPFYSNYDPNAPPDPTTLQCPDAICYNPVIVNDNYADTHPTNIVGVGAEPARVMGDPPPPATNVNRVFLGWGRINNKRQYDRLISFTGNGGGSEIKFCRVSGYLQLENQQITNFAGDRAEVSFTRKQINNATWKRVYGVWDPDWVVGNTEQVLAIYEEDTEGTQTFNGSLSTTATVPVGGGATITAARTLGYSVSVKTQDEIILQTKYPRISYFGAAKSDQGWGFQMCDTRRGSCRYDNTFLPVGQNWPKYNEGANWNFTFPYNSY